MTGKIEWILLGWYEWRPNVNSFYAQYDISKFKSHRSGNFHSFYFLALFLSLSVSFLLHGVMRFLLDAGGAGEFLGVLLGVLLAVPLLLLLWAECFFRLLSEESSLVYLLSCRRNRISNIFVLAFPETLFEVQWKQSSLYPVPLKHSSLVRYAHSFNTGNIFLIVSSSSWSNPQQNVDGGIWSHVCTNWVRKKCIIK